MRRSANVGAWAIRSGKAQLYTRDGKDRYWSPEDGEVCVEIRRDTPAEFHLWHCSPPEPFRVIRKGERLFEEAARLYAGEPHHVSWFIGFAGTPLHIYYRDGSIRAWDFKHGEIPVHVSPADRNLLIEGTPARPGKRRIDFPPTGLTADQVKRALHQQGSLKRKLLAI